MIKTHKEKMLETRIARLEKLIKGTKCVCESRESDLESAAEEWFWENCVESAFDDYDEWVSSTFALARRKNDIPVDLCIEDINADDGDDVWGIVEKTLSRCAKELIEEEGLKPRRRRSR